MFFLLLPQSCFFFFLSIHDKNKNISILINSIAIVTILIQIDIIYSEASNGVFRIKINKKQHDTDINFVKQIKYDF